MKVTCSLPYAGTKINGIDFEAQEDGSVVAAGLSNEAAAHFEDIPGYKVEEDGEEPAASKPGKGKKAATPPKEPEAGIPPAGEETPAA